MFFTISGRKESSFYHIIMKKRSGRRTGENRPVGRYFSMHRAYSLPALQKNSCRPTFKRPAAVPPCLSAGYAADHCLGVQRIISLICDESFLCLPGGCL